MATAGAPYTQTLTRQSPCPWVEPGTPIGAVGSTAICEVSQEEHLHFAITVNGEGVNPLNYLPA